MKGLIILTPEKELRQRKISQIIRETEGNFFSNPNSNPMLFQVQDIGYTLREEDIGNIKKRLFIPNLFRIKFDVSIRTDLHCFDNYLQIMGVA